MAAASIVLNDQFATIECDPTKHTITFDNVVGSLINIGPNTVYLSNDLGATALKRDDSHGVGEIPLPINSNAPIKIGRHKITNQCKAAESGVLLWIPQTD